MRLRVRENEIKIFLPPYPFRAAAAVSLDYETSAQSLRPGMGARLRMIYRRIFLKEKYTDLSFAYGRGYGNRLGAILIKKIFEEGGINGTWFATGHALLKSNRNGGSYRINQILDYATAENGFGFIEWRNRLKSFYHEPNGDCRSHPYFYLGDLTALLRDSGEDIQSHSFSHPYIPLESRENLAMDLEDWQKASSNEGAGPSRIFAFPYLGDFYCRQKQTGGIMLPSKCESQDDYENVYLDDGQIELFRNNGFELFTRCMSKDNESDFDDFREYNGSGINYINCRGLFSFDGPAAFGNYLNDLIREENIIDLWLHPNDILDQKRLDMFRNAMGILKNKKDSGSLWVATLNDMWERKKLIYNIAVEKIEKGFILINRAKKEIKNIFLSSAAGLYHDEGRKVGEIANAVEYCISLKPGEKAFFKEKDM